MKRYLSLLFILVSLSSKLIAFRQVVIWGHKLHTHTHSYIHEAFYRAFEHLGYKVYHFDNKDDVKRFDFSHSLFLTEGQSDQNIPILDDCFYILHNCNGLKYKKAIEENRAITIQVYTHGLLSRKRIRQLSPCVFISDDNKTINFPWATDLLPWEIEENKKWVIKNWDKRKQQANYIAWVGTIGQGTFGNHSEIQPFLIKSKNKFQWIAKGHLNRPQHISFIMNAAMAPTIVGEWQKQQGYIPCRIFKNISYGQAGITNSSAVYRLFNQNICYEADTEKLFNKALTYLKTYTLEDQLKLMDFVKNHHTYLNRIETIFNAFKKLSSGFRYEP